MEFPLLVNKEPKSLTIAPLPSGEGHTACIDGREYRLRWVPINDNEWLLDVDGRPIRACLAARGSETWVSIDGETYLVEEAGAAEPAPAAGRTGRSNPAGDAAHAGRGDPHPGGRGRSGQQGAVPDRPVGDEDGERP